MKDFKSFSDGNGADGKFENDKGVNLIKSVAASMKGKSGADIMKAIIAEAERGKRDGTLTNDDLDNFYALTAPSLDGFRRQKLKSIIARLKRI